METRWNKACTRLYTYMYILSRRFLRLAKWFLYRGRDTSFKRFSRDRMRATRFPKDAGEFLLQSMSMISPGFEWIAVLAAWDPASTWFCLIKRKGEISAVSPLVIIHTSCQPNFNILIETSRSSKEDTRNCTGASVLITDCESWRRIAGWV